MFKKLPIAIGLWLWWLVSRLPMPLIRVLGTGLGLIGYCIIRKRRRVGLLNLRLCFPEKTKAERCAILRQHFCELFISGLTYGWLFSASASRMKRLIKFRNFTYLEKFYGQRPVILLAPHFLALDIGGNRVTIDVAGYTMFSEPRNVYFGEKLKAARMRFLKLSGGEIFSRQQGLRSIVKKMKQNKWPFYYLPDQDMDAKNSVYVPFFAHPMCATLDTLPKLAKLADAVVIPMATYREGNHYVVEFWPKWENYPTIDTVADVKRMNRAIEEMILKHPEQYLWMHKRFKTQPGMARGALYADC